MLGREYEKATADMFIYGSGVLRIKPSDSVPLEFERVPPEDVLFVSPTGTVFPQRLHTRNS